ncbi:hypothetical protein GCM10007036_23520 [Alsobacter metallidurans]|uniref:TraB/GumN family protein n=1 Tax=Alsobacter metallidurans TaxID=340221 RepID=A0A917I7U3_9HYPH|nr:hypothetical protein GCM10007036_23520 [Alsobacter metallidurans]
MITGFVAVLAGWPARASAQGSPSLQGSAQTRPSPRPGAPDGIVYKIVRAGAPPSYLVGTLHLGDERVKLPRVVEPLLGEVRLVLLELDPKQMDGSPATAKRVARDLAESDPSRRAKALLSPTDFLALGNWMKERNLPARMLDGKLSALVLLLDGQDGSREADRGAGLDAQLAELSASRNLPVGGLETIVETVRALDDVPPQVLAEVLMRMMATRDQHLRIRERTVQYYEAGDDGGLYAWMRQPSYLSETPPLGLPPAFLEAILERRTAIFAARALPELDKGGVLIAVGAAHLAGPHGLVELLGRGGFNVRRLGR